MSATDGIGRDLAEARALLEMKRYPDAVRRAAHAAASDPGSAEAFTLIGIGEFQQGHNAQSLAAAQQALAIDPEREWPHRIAASALVRLGKKREAREAALRAVALAPDEFRSFCVLAQTLVANRDLAGAREAATRATSLAPEAPEPHVVMSYVMIKIEDWSAAEAAARRALALEPQNAGALNNLSVAVRRQGRREDATIALDEAARADPHSTVVRRNLRGLRWSRARRGFSAGTQALVADDARSRRFRPHRWNWKRLTYIRPWWWKYFRRMEPPNALRAYLALWVVAVLLSFTTPVWILWGVLFTLGLPFVVRRWWRWHRVQNPGSRSWRPDHRDEP